MDKSTSSAAPLAQIPETTVFDVIGLDQLRNAAVRVGTAYWMNQRGGHKFPAREDLKLREIAGVLRNTSLVKVLEGDFLFRVVGDAIVRAYAVPLHNRRLSAIEWDAPIYAGIARRLFAQVARSGEPLAVRGRIGRDVSEANFTDFENALLPLGSDHERVDHVLTVSAYQLRPIAL